MKYFLLLGLFACSSLHAKTILKAEPTELQKVSADMANAAMALLGGLNEEQVKKAFFPFDSEQREAWGFVPRERKGIPLEALDEKQVGLVRDLLKTALSDPGLKKVDAIMTLEAFLAEIEKRPDFRNPKAYFTSIFGEPSATGTWAWRFEGHHLSLNYTIVDGKAVSVTPSFFAANPGEVKIEHKLKGTRPFHEEEDLARALVTILKESGKDVIFSDKTPAEILTAEDRAVKQLEPVGIKATEMTETQQKALMELIAVYANRHRKELAENDIKAIQADLKNLRFGWAGGIKRDEPYYYRIQGTSFLVEVANVQNNGNHFHGVWRDAKNDFGRDLLGGHVKHEH
jgi:Protein of unknown function (DUF3500)